MRQHKQQYQLISLNIQMKCYRLAIPRWYTEFQLQSLDCSWLTLYGTCTSQENGDMPEYMCTAFHDLKKEFHA